ncbi:two pore domain potassium channel family protein [Paroceanicella profunda]|uniref:Two pore domain potassium channel family protein n=1 Tax=Paroceanicella profunda TaxID=2579971 RepID=A0A5B8FSA7_9RHOB|nr:ion channel [Paroceanicella profunda]QDL91656.1 two pore domain potassium channel family protein [Paroceanicella profunda]
MANLLLGLAVTVACTVIECAMLAFLGSSLRHRVNRVRAPGFLHDTALIAGALLVLLFGNLAQVWVWAWVLKLLGEFPTVLQAYYFALTSFTTLGYGDVVLSPGRAILGPLAAANGVLMFGLSTGVLIWVIGALTSFGRMRGLPPHDPGR